MRPTLPANLMLFDLIIPIFRDYGRSAWSGHMGFVVDRASLGRIFSEYFGFLCQL
jgi:hypothetical protein